MPLVAFNVILDTANLEMANKIAKNVRHLSGGLRYCKAIGIDMEDRGVTQVSMNMTDFTKHHYTELLNLLKLKQNVMV